MKYLKPYNRLFNESTAMSVFAGTGIQVSKGSALTKLDMAKAYDNYDKTYQKYTGKSWTEDKFMKFARNWLFYGNQASYIAARPQRSGGMKLVTVARDLADPQADAVLKQAFVKVMQTGTPLWGLVFPNIAIMMKKAKFIALPSDIMRDMIEPYMGMAPLLDPNGIVHGGDFKVNGDNTINVKDSQLGTLDKKVFIVSKSWCEHSIRLLTDRLNGIARRIGKATTGTSIQDEIDLIAGVIDRLSKLANTSFVLPKNLKMLTSAG